MAENQKIVLHKVLLRIRKYWAGVIGALMLAGIYVIMSLLIPVLVGNAIDHILAPGNVDFSSVTRNLFLVAVCTVLAAMAQWFMNLIHNYVTYCVTRDLRKEVFSHIQQLPVSYLDSHPQGDLISRVVSDIDTFGDGLLMGFTQLFTGIMSIAGTLLIMLRIHWGVALVVILVTPLSLFVAKFIASHTYSMFQCQTRTRGEQTALIDETIGALDVVKAFSHEDQTLSQFDEINTRLRKFSLRAIFFSSLTNPCTRFVNSVVYAGVGLTGALISLSGGISVGNLAALLSYANQYTKPFNEISGVITELQNALACADRVFELAEAPARTPDPVAYQSPEKVRGAVEIRNLSFSYTDRPFLENLNLSVKPGQRVAIVGPTGCGKTTMINLLMRFYDPRYGSICLDGVDTRNMKRDDLRACAGMVLQDTWLCSGTVAENISMGRPDATREQIERAARMAYAHSFIKRLPKGYDTPVGECGDSLSQGQKQLLCIARVMLCLPPMLLLDEATSSIDTRTEIRVQKAFDALMEGRTTFVVAHRLSTIREADLILVMRNGKIIEQGTHEQLLKQGGFYAELYESQFAH